jgi:8-oxo-dGTP pyrophosphatase MutT (NUDIX family)
VSDEIRKAASVIAVRDGDGAPEVLLLERSSASRFLAGYVVFPGGAVDAEDAARAAAWFNSPDEAARAAAVRELAEEAGLALTASGLRASPAGDHLAPVVADPPSVAQLPEIAHWVAPPDVRVRFDARYFAVRAEGGVEPTPDGREAAHAWWSSPAELMAGWEAGERTLFWPTWVTMQTLARCADAEAILAARVEPREPDDDELDRLPRSVFWDD